MGGGQGLNVSGEPQDGDGEVTQAGHDAGAAGGADLGAVFVEVHVPVQAALDGPVAADDGGEFGGGWPGRRSAR
jgi:hypothetical protein